MAKLINADPKEIVFTSGATESNNIAVKGVGRFYKEKKKHVVTTQTVRFVSLVFSSRFRFRLGTQMCFGFDACIGKRRFQSNIFTCAKKWFSRFESKTKILMRNFHLTRFHQGIGISFNTRNKSLFSDDDQQ